MSPVSDGKTFNFWAGGHIVYFECVLTANFILLRSTHNFTGWCELLIFLQVTSFFWLLYLDSIWLTSPISYFFDEFFGSLTAWLGVLFVGGILVIEKAAVDAYVFIGPRLNWCRYGKQRGAGMCRVAVLGAPSAEYMSLFRSYCSAQFRA